MNFELIFVECCLANDSLVVGASYIPPGSQIDLYRSILDTLDLLPDRLKNGNIVLTGDFNLPCITWDPNQTRVNYLSSINATNRVVMIADFI